ncbi:hypothetical protein ACN38_g5276 [Penicillium nordicum]|uniref:Berberine/berberine-like domain-containing protein n=1 Tax=Penicillium nordicum TaxID=229535 RepID=A0A0N0RYZ7_9EURO|nr:hypothetical protein ACN38_g5276 [Penicillium nordicum]
MCESEVRRAGHKPDKLVSTFFGYTHGEYQTENIGLEKYILTLPLDDNMTPEDMFGVNADALLNVKRKYDRDNVFNKLNPLEVSS